ncbi:insulinase family protein, partial [Stutzerimonas stutzeri]|uniref:insulinase family protein n=1 Tax=Stutzerimonas stutzeri TaxID=316 RepID=UPI003F7468AC
EKVRQAGIIERSIVRTGMHTHQRRGLAHFLEHLLFLGSHGYPQAQSLMPFVQGCGGQLNASTRERHTDFFFQVPSDAFDDALKRLLDMLARPLLDPAAQLR